MACHVIKLANECDVRYRVWFVVCASYYRSSDTRYVEHEKEEEEGRV